MSPDICEAPVSPKDSIYGQMHGWQDVDLAGGIWMLRKAVIYKRKWIYKQQKEKGNKQAKTSKRANDLLILGC